MPGELKVHVDASYFLGAEAFTVGMVIRDHNGVFIEGKCISLPCPITVVEAESIRVSEALLWVMKASYRRIIVESDSLLTVRALHGKSVNVLEIGHVIENCMLKL